MLAAGAARDCSNIFFLSPITSLFFFPLSGMARWTICGLSHFQQNFSDIRTMMGGGLLFAIKSHLRWQISQPEAGLESGTARSAGHRLPD